MNTLDRSLGIIFSLDGDALAMRYAQRSHGLRGGGLLERRVFRFKFFYPRLELGDFFIGRLPGEGKNKPEGDKHDEREAYDVHVTDSFQMNQITARPNDEAH